MSRPSSYHDSAHYVNIEDNFSLPLFNAHPPSIPPGRPSVVDASAHLPPPPAANLQQRHSIHHLPSFSSPYNGGGDGVGGGPASPRPAGVVPPPSTRPKANMNSAVPYSVAYPQSSHPSTPLHADELMPPPSASSGLGALARSASLGSRKKDPYAYSSDDVESGLGNMDMGVEPSWPGYGGGGNGATRQSFASQGQGQAKDRDVIMSPGVGGYGVSGPTNTNNIAISTTQMNPPPVPPHALNRPPAVRNDSGGSSPSRRAYQAHGHSSSLANQYVPRGSDPGPSAHNQWSEYRPPPTGSRLPSTGSYHSAASEGLSPYAPPAQLGASPHTPLLNPYDAPSPGAFPPSPSRSSQTQWRGSSSYRPPSPGSSVPHPSNRSLSHQIYPASQPATPAGKLYESGPPRDTRSRGSTSRQGFREVRDWSDLKPIVNEHPSGRRADPNSPGRYLSVSLHKWPPLDHCSVLAVRIRGPVS
jgi:hypothetical protein